MKIQRFMEINKIIVGSNVKILKWHINFQSINKVLGTQLPQTIDGGSAKSKNSVFYAKIFRLALAVSYRMTVTVYFLHNQT
jgi:hypothetical protein